MPAPGIAHVRTLGGSSGCTTSGPTRDERNKSDKSRGRCNAGALACLAIDHTAYNEYSIAAPTVGRVCCPQSSAALAPPVVRGRRPAANERDRNAAVVRRRYRNPLPLTHCSARAAQRHTTSTRSIVRHSGAVRCKYARTTWVQLGSTTIHSLRTPLLLHRCEPLSPATLTSPHNCYHRTPPTLSRIDHPAPS